MSAICCLLLLSVVYYSPRALRHSLHSAYPAPPSPTPLAPTDLAHSAPAPPPPLPLGMARRFTLGLVLYDPRHRYPSAYALTCERLLCVRARSRIIAQMQPALTVAYTQVGDPVQSFCARCVTSASASNR
ncbi:hypothetical protein DFH09DRAFT_1300285 [Mycena vulgaris]|nr:hypothetical protein DFH09DRAFT_1300285 [Mycena vulgaris]